MKNIFFITHFSSKFGFGHIKRCLSIAGHFPKVKKIIINLENQKLNTIFNQKVYPKNYLKKLNNEKSVNIIDLLPKEYYKNKSLFLNLKKKNSFIIDNGFKQKTIFYNSIYPYINNGETVSKYVGEKYFILDKKIIEISLKKKNKKNRVLICMGGSDPDCFTEKVLRIFVKIKHDLKVDVIIGPYFDKIRTNNIKKIVKNKKNYTFHLNPRNIYEIISRSKFGVVSYGNIKYESIFLNTPVILLSNRKHQKICVNFSKKFNTINNKFTFNRNKIYRLLENKIFDTNLMNSNLKLAIKNIDLNKFNKTIKLIKKINENKK